MPLSTPQKKTHKHGLDFYLGFLFLLCSLLVFVLYSPSTYAASWNEVEQLIKERKIASANKMVRIILQQAQQDKHMENWTKALITRADNQLQQGEIETAVREFKQTSWPEEPQAQWILQLYYAHTLTQYIEHYQWEINQRETIESKQAIDFTKMTMPQLVTYTHQAYQKAYQLTAKLAPSSTLLDTLETLKPYFKLGDYPASVRGTLHDTVTYLWVDFLRQQQLWSPQQANQTERLSVQQLLASPPQAIDYTNENTHPAIRITSLLNQLEQQHRTTQRPEATLEAWRVRLHYIATLKTAKHERQRLIDTLTTRLANIDNRLLWVNRLRLTLAQWIRNTDAANANIKALPLLEQCITQLRQAPLYKKLATQCQSEIAQIKQPSLQMQSMLADGLNKRSIRIEHKNINTLYFRAWRLPPQDGLNFNNQSQQKFAQQTMQKAADIAWTETLPTNQDYKSHKTYITPPIKQLGFWLIAASTSDDFKTQVENASLSVTTLNITHMVAKTHIKQQTLEVTVYNGETGQRITQATVELWQIPYNKTAKRLKTIKTNQDGYATLKLKEQQRHKLLIQYQQDSTLSSSLQTGYQYAREKKTINALIFTDRAIYRPQQTIEWKVVAYQGQSDKGNYRTLANSKGYVELIDANGKVVDKKTVKTNSFGSASGVFTAKAGKMLGNWYLRTSWHGNQTIKVEEYKRPTFNAVLNDNVHPLRLNQKATVKGTATYYFGQAVTEGKVTWRVTRKPHYNWVWYSRGFAGLSHNTRTETIATGNTTLNQAGEFSLSFLPQAAKATNTTEPHLISYYFEVNADITDAGGETRSVQRSYRLGHTAIEATINHQQQYGNSNQDYIVDIQRTDLDGVGRAGKATWSLHTIQQPQQPILSVDQPLTLSKQQQTYATVGDTLQPRWASIDKQQQDTSALFNQWSQGKLIQQNALQHDATGHAQLNLGQLDAGLYRLNYQTKDAWGQPFKAQKTILISNQQQTPIQVPLLLQAQTTHIEVGDSLQLLAGSGFEKLPVTLDIYQNNQLLQRTQLQGGIKPIHFPISQAHRGGLTVVLSAVKDYQLLRQQQHIHVPWSDRKLKLEFNTFRDKLRPGATEKWRITVKDHTGKTVEKDAIEVLALMYDRSLDIFAPLTLTDTQNLYPKDTTHFNHAYSLGSSYGLINWNHYPYATPTAYQATRLIFSNHYGRYRLNDSVERGGAAYAAMAAPAPVAVATRSAAPAPKKARSRGAEASPDNTDTPKKTADTPTITTQVRENFNETAFFYPHLRLEKDGSVSFEFDVPESVTQWKVWLAALSNDLRSGVLSKMTRTSKELMVRPYLPRFLREGDQAEIKVVVNNSSDQDFAGQVHFELYDPETEKSLADSFKLDNRQRHFSVSAGQSTTLRFRVTTPHQAGLVAIRTTAQTDNFSDGEQRALAILPSRIHLTQSVFTTLTNGKADQKTLTFPQLATNNQNDNSLIHDKLVVTLDGQLFYSVLNALPYLVDYPYQCTEQTLNRFLSTSIITSVFDQHPAIATMAKKMARRDTQLPTWKQNDANRNLLLEETPWLHQAEGGSKSDRLMRILDPTIAQQQQQTALQKLRKAQTASGGFPWWEGGQASPYITAYLLHGFAKALEFNPKIPISKEMVQRGWRYLHTHYQQTLKKPITSSNKSTSERHLTTLLNYILSSYADNSWTDNIFSDKDRQTMLDDSFQHWTSLPPLLKSYLALTLHRAGRTEDARLVFDSILDLLKTDPQRGSYFAPEAQTWLWYNDTVDTHAFVLRTLNEINPTDPRRHGLVQWLMINKKLNHWKSTRATAESIYALTHYLQQEGQLGNEERAQVSIGNHLKQSFVFKADEYTGDNNQLVVKGKEITPDMANITIKKDSKNLMFASANWHFSTEKAPDSAHGDFLAIQRRFFKRVQKNNQWVLQPLQEGATLAVGDQLEIQLSLRAKHNAEYIHLRSPRGAGFEPMKQTSGYQWQLGIGYYEEIRDSGTNYFFERLPAGEYHFKYRVRATTTGIFRVAPATVQSMYAPEFSAYSTGKRVNIQ